MSSWSETLDALNQPGVSLDDYRLDLIRRISGMTGRNVICYYSGWLQKDAPASFVSIVDDDMNGFMNSVYGLDRERGLDLILHTPGGDVAATEAIVHYLRSCFNEIRVIVPQLAMSAGTMIACASDVVIMGRESSLGPTDPQLRGVAAGGVLKEFDQAVKDVERAPQLAHVWQPIIGQYGPTFLGDCENAVRASQSMISEWLTEYMYRGESKPEKVKSVVDTLCEHDSSGMHNRHFSYESVSDMGIKVIRLEDSPDLQEQVLSLHHAFMCTFAMTNTVKVVEGSNGQRWIKILNVTA